MPGRFELTSTLAKIWHAPDHFRLLDPLPPMHRRELSLASCWLLSYSASLR
ncbi:putative cell envelope opacity-associated protein A [Klebsiella pneumoniae]|uniref:Putative cell envelope opacity-associated protein A n=1 Tax=Klebsiella pneumoniae TaxID=573 RepID=A0A2X3GTJ6_KLEPN|nr:putative cell envelope opacity-associated protein A [Klebsiella pneumoniae]